MNIFSNNIDGWVGVGPPPYDFFLKEIEAKKMKFKIIENVDGGDGDMAVYKDGECLFFDHGHNFDLAKFLIRLGFEVEFVDEYDSTCATCGEFDYECECSGE